MLIIFFVWKFFFHRRDRHPRYIIMSAICILGNCSPPFLPFGCNIITFKYYFYNWATWKKILVPKSASYISPLNYNPTSFIVDFEITYYISLYLVTLIRFLTSNSKSKPQRNWHSRIWYMASKNYNVALIKVLIAHTLHLQHLWFGKIFYTSIVTHFYLPF